MEKFLTILLSTFAIAITFGLAVFVHEFGHMLFALLRGVGVESFAIGMGPKITSWKWRGIDFSLRWFPIGGFVKLQAHPPEATVDAADHPTTASPAQVIAEEARGDVATAPQDDDKSLAESSYDDLYALQDKGFLTKVLVFGGGVFMNYVTAVLTIAAVLFIGFKVDLVRIKLEKIEPGTVLAKAGLAPGDQIVGVDGKPVTYYNDFDTVVADSLNKAEKDAKHKQNGDAQNPKVNLTLTLDRGGSKKIVALPAMDRDEVKAFLEAMQPALWYPSYVRDVTPNQAADKAGLRKGDEIVAVDGKPVSSREELVALIGPNVNKETTLKVKRGDKFFEATVTPRPGIEGAGEDPKRGYIGIVLSTPETRKDRVANPLRAIYLAQLEAVDKVVKIVKTNVKFFQTASMKEVRENVTGPIGIAAITAKMAQNGIEELVNWFILLNLLLMVFNLLPLPVLDGGFILLAVIEGVIRRPVPPKVLAPIYTVFVVGFIILMVLISVQDLFNWVPRLLH